MLTKHLFIFFAIFGSTCAMEVQECAIQMNTECGLDALSNKISTILNSNDSAMKSIIRDLLTNESAKNSSSEQKRQKQMIIKKITDSDE